MKKIVLMDMDSKSPIPSSPIYKLLQAFRYSSPQNAPEPEMLYGGFNAWQLYIKEANRNEMQDWIEIGDGSNSQFQQIRKHVSKV